MQHITIMCNMINIGTYIKQYIYKYYFKLGLLYVIFVPFLITQPSAFIHFQETIQLVYSGIECILFCHFSLAI